MFSKYVDIDLYVSMHIAKEATQSSRIEGTMTNIKEAFMTRDDIAVHEQDGWEEVQNYINALNLAISQLKDLPFSSRLICRTHETLMQGVRGHNKMPGQFRRSQNWIGGATIADAVFVPPPATEIPALMSDLEKFANDRELVVPELLKVALIHYQFETIHPFLEGNGRVGRLLIPLYLIDNGILEKPILYLSDFFERHRNLYYDNLMRVRTHHDLTQWFKFFLTGIIETAKSGIHTFDGILQLKSDVDQRLKSFGSRAEDAHKVIVRLYQNPIITASQVTELIGKSKASAYRLITDLEKCNILGEITGGERDRIYVFDEYLELFSGKG